MKYFRIRRPHKHAAELTPERRERREKFEATVEDFMRHDLKKGAYDAERRLPTKWAAKARWITWAVVGIAALGLLAGFWKWLAYQG